MGILQNQSMLPTSRWELQKSPATFACHCWTCLNYSAELFVYKQWRPNIFFQFEIIINVLVFSFLFIWIPMLWVYGHYKYFNSFSAGTIFIRQNLTSTDVWFWRIKTIPALTGLNLDNKLSSNNPTEIPATGLKTDIVFNKNNISLLTVLWETFSLDP